MNHRMFHSFIALHLILCTETTCVCFVCFDLDTVLWSYMLFKEIIEITLRSGIRTGHRLWLRSVKLTLNLKQLHDVLPWVIHLMASMVLVIVISLVRPGSWYIHIRWLLLRIYALHISIYRAIRNAVMTIHR